MITHRKITITGVIFSKIDLGTRNYVYYVLRVINIHRRKQWIYFQRIDLRVYKSYRVKVEFVNLHDLMEINVLTTSDRIKICG